MKTINIGVACDVKNCKWNSEGCNCTLSKIHVGCGCVGEDCTCCESFVEQTTLY
ncbi:MAG: DUF1540 domain-containing protein [Clostridia bacterium]|nr:DUF1540 domain-containing protein [Clostridia bacterium]